MARRVANLSIQQDYKAKKRQAIRGKVSQQLKTALLRRSTQTNLKEDMLTFLDSFAGTSNHGKIKRNQKKKKRKKEQEEVQRA